MLRNRIHEPWERENASQCGPYFLCVSHAFLEAGPLSVTSFPQDEPWSSQTRSQETVGGAFWKPALLNQDMQSELKQRRGGQWVSSLALDVVGFHGAELTWKTSEAERMWGEDSSPWENCNVPVASLCSALKSFPFFPLQQSGSLITFSVAEQSRKRILAPEEPVIRQGWCGQHCRRYGNSGFWKVNSARRILPVHS